MSKALDIEAFVQAAADAIIAAGADGKMFFGIPRRRGFSASCGRSLGKSLDLIIPERFRARHDRLSPVISTGKTKYQRNCCASRPTQRMPTDVGRVYGHPARAPGAGTVIVAIVRDETRGGVKNAT